MRFLLIPVFAFSFLSIIWTQCPEGEIQLSNQQQLNDFAAAYPQCSKIPGNVKIGIINVPSDIRDLTPLNNIRSIGGFLNILNNPLLTDLHGLENLSSVRGYLNLFKNDQLTNLNGLANLVSVNGFLWIIHNPSLISMEGLQNLTSINGSLDVSFNSTLNSFNGLGSIKPQTITTTMSYLLTPIIDVRLLKNGNQSETNLPNIAIYRENNGPTQRFYNMIHKPYSKRAVETHLIYKRLQNPSDTIEAYRIVGDLSDIAQNSGDSELIWESELLKNFYQLMNGSASLPHRIARMKKLADRAGLEGKWQIQARALKLIALRYKRDLRDYEKLFKTFDALQRAIKRIGPEDFPDRAQCYMMMGLAHYLFRDYRNAVHFFRKGAAIPKTPLNTTFITHCINNLGLSYQKLNLPDSSDYYFNQIIQDTSHRAVEIWKGIASGNLGYNHYLRKEYDEAVPLLQRDIGTAESLEDWGLAAGSLIPLADIRIVQNRLTEAEEHILHAREYIHLSGQKDRLRLLYPVMGKWHAATGHKDRAAEYIDSTQQAIRAYNNKFNALKLLRARQELNAYELQLQEVKRQKLLLQRNLIVTIFILLFVSGSIFVWYRNKNLRHKQEIRELVLHNTQESLVNALSRLNDLTRKIRENNTIINSLQKKTNESGNQKILQELKKTTILTKEDWQQFKKHFQQAYPGFLSSLRSQYPDLTPAEIRILCLRKLDLTNNEMASAQGVSPNSIIVTQYRIRKKLNLKNQEMLEKLVRAIR